MVVPMVEAMTALRSSASGMASISLASAMPPTFSPPDHLLHSAQGSKLERLWRELNKNAQPGSPPVLCLGGQIKIWGKHEHRIIGHGVFAHRHGRGLCAGRNAQALPQADRREGL